MGHESYSKRDLRAIKLGVTNARILLAIAFPMVYKRFTDSEIAQVQYVLDAAAVNADVEKQYNAAMRNAISSRIGNQVNYDQRVVARGDKIRRTAMSVTKNDYHIRLDFKHFIAPNALLPKSNNPDELEYLTHVKHALENHGIWLNLETYWYDTKEHAFNRDKTRFRVWLTYGKNGRAIEANLGCIGRDQILRAVSLGKGFYDEVYHGPVAQQFDKLVTKAKINIELGMDSHKWLIKRNKDAFPGVVTVAEFLGDADDLPDISSWEALEELIYKAQQTRGNGDMQEAFRILCFALLAAKTKAVVLKNYENATTKGAQKAVKILTVVAVIGACAALAVGTYGAMMAARGRGIVSLADLGTQGEIEALNLTRAEATEWSRVMVEYEANLASEGGFATRGYKNIASKGIQEYRSMGGL